MKRYALDSLINWKNSRNRKPLVIYGARQVGKTWLMREFGRTAYKNAVYLNFDTTPELGDYFQKDLDPARIIAAISAHYGINIVPTAALIILDEIQECQRAKDSLKYFYESAPEYHIVAAGSFLGVASGKFPVGKVDRLTVYPMSFYEFLEAVDRGALIRTLRERDKKLIETLSGKLIDLLRAYFYVGGMPDAVAEYAKTQDLTEVRRIQNGILDDYKNDFSKHIKNTDIPKVRMLWDSIPTHLAREKKKFIYSEIKTGGRAAEFENAMDWLINTGLVYKIPRTMNPKIPLARDVEREAFKLFMLDTGLLCAKSNIDLSMFYTGDPKIFADFNGALTEQFVCQELKANYDNPLFYWGRDKGAAEVDFIVQYKNEIVPIEVKSAYNKRAQSLDVYMDLVKPAHAIKTSMRNLGEMGNLYSVPLYMISEFTKIIKGITND